MPKFPIRWALASARDAIAGQALAPLRMTGGPHGSQRLAPPLSVSWRNVRNGGWAMPEARHEVTIRRPASEVFAFIADGLNGPKWRIRDPRHRPRLRERDRRDGTSRVSKGPGGRRMDADYRVTDL